MIIADKLVKNYGSFRAVDQISFEVKKGEILGFLGPNGAGKSTTMKMLTGFLKPCSGTAKINGYDISENPIEAKKAFGYLPENGPLYPEMTVFEFLSFIAEMRQLKGQTAIDAIAKTIQRCHLGGVIHQTIETLSKGFRQRVGMAQAILHDPQCLIMDEPTDGLDPNQKQEVRNLIQSMAADKAIILSTHILEEVEAMCTRVIIIACGKVIADESPNDLKRRHPDYNAIKIDFVDEAQVQEAMIHLAEYDFISDLTAMNKSLIIHPMDKANIQKDIHDLILQNKWGIEESQLMPTDLTEVFRELTLQQAS